MNNSDIKFNVEDMKTNYNYEEKNGKWPFRFALIYIHEQVPAPFDKFSNSKSIVLKLKLVQ